jgi:50S ribosomal subunit-associated GTPase HflX
MKVRRVTSKYFFTKGKLQELGEFLCEKNIEAVFINNELSAIQIRNLEK